MLNLLALAGPSLPGSALPVCVAWQQLQLSRRVRTVARHAVQPVSAVAAPAASGVPPQQPQQQQPLLESMLEGLLQQQQAAGGQATLTPTADAGQAAGTAREPQCMPLAPDTASSAVRMESQLIFDSCWRRFKEKHGTDFAAPREVIWLNGAPGSGKGVTTPHILKARGMSRSVCVSSLLSAAPEARAYKEAGEMIADHVVGELLLEALLLPASRGLSTAELNLVVDGFPRTAVQVDFVKLLMDKLTYLHTKYADTPIAARFPRPSFKVVVLYVDEQTSISRQLQRAVAAQAHNARVKDAGLGERQLQEERSTDILPDKARKRYSIFKQHYSAIMRLKQFFPFHLIDAMGSPADTHEQVTQELRYQSSLDLSEETYTAIRHLPLAADLKKTARQQLVSRLESYCQQHRALFGRVLGLLQQHVVPLLQQGALAGSAEWVSQEALFSQHPGTISMLLDVLADRGFQAHYARELLPVPASFDAASGTIATQLQPLHRFRFSFEAPGVRDASALKALEIAARISEAARSSSAAAAAAAASSSSAAPPGGLVPGAAAAAPITETVIPEHLDLEAKMRAQDLRRVQLARAGGCDGRSGDGSVGCSGGAGECGSSGDSGDAIFTIHRCLRPDANCGHAQELEVVSASG